MFFNHFPSLLEAGSFGTVWEGKFSLFSLLSPLSPFPWLWTLLKSPSRSAISEIVDSYYCIWYEKGHFHIKDVDFQKIICLFKFQLEWFMYALMTLVKEPEWKSFIKNGKERHETTRLTKFQTPSGWFMRCVARNVYEVQSFIYIFSGDSKQGWFSFLFCKYDERMLLKLKEAIRLFEWCSGQKVNWKKLALSGVNVSEDALFQKAAQLGCKAEKLPILYLGLPLRGYPRRKEFWQPVIDRVHKKLDRWKRFNISRGGRQTLCNAVLASLPTYHLSLFSIPGNMAASFEKNHEELLLGRLCWWQDQPSCEMEFSFPSIK